MSRAARSDPDRVIWHTALLLVAAGHALAGCAATPDASSPAPAPVTDAPAPDWRGDAARAASNAADAASRAARATWRAARGAGGQMQTAARGIRDGFERVSADADYGSYPSSYTAVVRKHFQRVLRFPETSSFRFGRPRKGYMNHGLLRGGGVAWRGYLVDVEVTRRTALFGSAVRAEPYVVRLRDGEVIDVHKGAEHRFLGDIPE